ncbi:uncharacterized protein HMPREF1541_04041 [Cyphellophora europaea CBS 101466]|uniref:Uncharacterized protein n=1 Tax=Cyphellophora europaea (strain CBS 101466) TaxID=1220924 RepID=W2S087_CYPE1|nr:uncharacterized protein HMPREF1541_04041 [Cyphellophora europaea CBS 101466]ETN42102.1 hypothetical protein HMPREF1541_04041 [Cyphellophora europaea CBS 101466]
MFNSSLRRAARSAPSIPSRPTTPSIAPFTSRTHQRRHSSSKPPAPPNNNGSPTIPADVKQVTPRSEAKAESKKPAERSSKKKAAAPAKAEANEAQENWTSSFPSVPTTAHMGQKDLAVASFYAIHRPVSITGPGPKAQEASFSVDQIFAPKPSKSRAKQTNEFVLTLSSALDTLNNAIADKQAQTQAQSAQPSDDSTSPQKELFRVVDGSGNQFKVVSSPAQNAFRPFHPPPPPTALSQEQIDALDRRAASVEEAGEEALASQLEAQIQGQDAQAAAARGRRDRAKLEALLNPSSQTHSAEIVVNTKTLREKYSFFTPTEPAPVQEPGRTARVGQRRRRGFAVQVPGKRKVTYRMISVKRQRKLKMKKHKYKKVSCLSSKQHCRDD